MKMIAIVLLLMAAAPVPAQAPLVPSGKWVVTYEEADCILSRDFGSGSALTTIGFKPSPFWDNVEIVVMTAGAKGIYRKGKAKMTLQPSGLTIDKDVEIYGLKAKNRMVTTMMAEADAAATLRTSTGVTIAVVDGPTTTITVADMKSAFHALRTCQIDLLKGWGIDPVELDTVATGPVGASPATWITADDYPSDAFSKQGTTVIIWTVGTGGRVTDCKVVKSSGTSSLDQAACRAITTRGRYSPAIGTDGMPMAVHQMRKVKWLVG